MKNIQMVDLQTQYTAIEEEIDRGIKAVIQSGKFINGPVVRAFETELAEHLSAAHCIACANGTDALQIALMALGLKRGDEVITVAFTFVATAEVILLLGLTPVFVDVDPHTFNMDVEQLEQAIGPKTKCIIPVHLFGQAANMEAIMNIAHKHQIAVVEDNAQAIGATVRFSEGHQAKAGTIGHIGTTSFYPSKNLGAYGDAGALFTNDDLLAEKIRLICNHGSKKKYHYTTIGLNSRLDSIQAVVLLAKLKRLDQYQTNRQAAAQFYDHALADLPNSQIPQRASWSTHVFHQYTLIVKQGRDLLKKTLQDKGIPTMIYYPKPLHLGLPYKQYSAGEGSLPVTEQLCHQVLSLPMHTELEEEQLLYISESIKDIITAITIS